MSRRLTTTAALVVAMAMAPGAEAHVPGTSHSTPGHEAALAVAASATNLLYFPAKVGVATAGLLGGAVVGLFTGGDVRAAYAVWVPTAGGDYLVRPAHLDGARPLSFFGGTYPDEPSEHRQDGSFIYESLYAPPPDDVRASTPNEVLR